MRKSGLITLLVIFILTTAVYYIISDEFIERQLESALSSAVGAKVEIDGFNFSIFSMSVGWDRMQITDPNNTMTNIIETGKAVCDIAPEPLFYGRWVIEEIRLERLRSGTPRETDGSLPVEQLAPSGEPSAIDKISDNIATELEAESGIDFSKLDSKVDVNAVLSTFNFKTIDNLTAFQSDIQQTIDKWENEWKSLGDIRTRSEDVVKKAKTISINNLKKIDDFIRTANTIKEIRGEAVALKSEVEGKKESVTADFKRFDQTIKLVDNWIKSDMEEAKKRAKLPDLDAGNIANMLFGRSLTEKVNESKKYYNVAQKYGRKLAPTGKVESPPRFKGQDISFPDRRNQPKLWVKKIVISGETGSTIKDEGIVLTGTADNIASDQTKTGAPTVLLLTGKKANGRAYEIGVVLDYREESGREDFTVKIFGISLNNTKLSGSSLLPDAVDSGTMDAVTTFTITQGKVDGKIDFIASALKFDFGNRRTTGRIEKITREIMESVNTVDLKLRFSGNLDNLNVSMNSNLDDLFSAKLKSIVGEQVRQGKLAVEREVRKRLEPEVRNATAFLNQKKKDLETRFAGMEKQVLENIKVAEQYKDELNKRIDNEKNPLLRQALKAVKSIIKW